MVQSHDIRRLCKRRDGCSMLDYCEVDENLPMVLVQAEVRNRRRRTSQFEHGQWRATADLDALAGGASRGIAF